MELRIDSKCVHGKNDLSKKHGFGAVASPIYQTATFAHPGVGKSTGYDYARVTDPTRDELEQTISALEGAYDTVACTTGMAALRILMDLFLAGDHFVCTEDLYGGSVRYFDTLAGKAGLTFSYVDTSSPKAVEAAITKRTKAIYLETPSNPTMTITDLRKMREIADAHGLLLIIDNTFLSPYYMNPLALGADFVIHSGTKYIAGHNDTLAGFLCCKSPEYAEKIRYIYKTVGSCLSPFDSFLVLRGLKTLALRMDKIQASALELALWLRQQEKVKDVFYIGLPDHPGHEIHKSQARGFGGMISFHVDSPETATKLLENVKLISYAESLGGVESLITYPMLQTHGDVPEEVRTRLGITDTFLRFSVGIENAEDLKEDLKQAFA